MDDLCTNPVEHIARLEAQDVAGVMPRDELPPVTEYIVRASRFTFQFDPALRSQPANKGCFHGVCAGHENSVDKSRKEGSNGLPSGQERFVALTRLFDVGGAADAADVHGKADEVSHERFAFGAVAIEQLVRRLAVEDESELPGKIGGVANARAHALAHKGRHDVRGVARKNDAADLPVVEQFGLEDIRCLADELDVVTSHPSSHKGPRSIGLLRPFLLPG